MIVRLRFRYRFRYLVVAICVSAGLLSFSSMLSTVRTPGTRAASHRNIAQAQRGVGGRGAVAVYDWNDFHEEVHGPVLWSLTQFEGLDIRLYRRPWRWMFDLTIAHFWIASPKVPESFIIDLRNDHTIRHIIMTTSDWDWSKIGSDIEAAWDERPDEAKFDLTVIRHWANQDDTRRLTGMAKRRALAMIGLGHHVGRALRETVEKTIESLAIEGDDDAADAWSKVKIRTFVPVFPAGKFPEPGDEVFNRRSDNESAMNVVIIQSTHFDAAHRDMQSVFTVLNDSLHGKSRSNEILPGLSNLPTSLEDPALWGYAAPTESTPYFSPLPSATGIFTLYTVGATPSRPPDVLREVVRTRTNYIYPHFYEAMHSADLILPAFGRTGYDVDRVSSTIGIAGSSEVSCPTTSLSLSVADIGLGSDSGLAAAI